MSKWNIHTIPVMPAGNPSNQEVSTRADNNYFLSQAAGEPWETVRAKGYLEQAGDTVILFLVKVPRLILAKLSGNSASQCPVYLSSSVSPVIFCSIFSRLIYDAKSFFQASCDFHYQKKKSCFINFLPVAPKYELTCRLKKTHTHTYPHSSQHTMPGLI